jgi:hypothetical protein
MQLPDSILILGGGWVFHVKVFHFKAAGSRTTSHLCLSFSALGAPVGSLSVDACSCTTTHQSPLALPLTDT